MAHWIKAHTDDPDCPPMRMKRGDNIPRAPRSAKVKAVKFLKERYKQGAGDMRPLEAVCDILDNPKTRARVKLQAAQLAHEIAHGKIAPDQTMATVQVNQQVVQATTEGQPSGQLAPGDRARHLAGLLKATAVVGDVCEGHAPGGAAAVAGDAPAGGVGAPADGVGGGRGAGA